MRDPVRFIPLCVLVAGCLLLASIRAHRATPLEAPLASLPSELPGHGSVDRVVSEAEVRVAGMTSYLLRDFVRDSSVTVSLYVGYYDRQSRGRSIHSPRNCLPGAGWEMMSVERVPVATSLGSVTLNRVVLDNQGRRALAYYWYQGRGRVTASEYVVKWNLLKDAATSGRSEEALVRLVLPLPASGDPQLPVAIASADSLARATVATFVPSLAHVLPSRADGSVARGRAASAQLARRP